MNRNDDHAANWDNEPGYGSEPPYFAYDWGQDFPELRPHTEPPEPSSQATDHPEP